MPIKPVLFILLFSLCSKGMSQPTFSSDLELFNVITGSNISIDEFKSNAALVLVFTSISCPYSKLYSDRIVSLSKKYEEQNVKFVLVNSNSDQSQGLESMKDAASNNGNKLLYFSDKNLTLKTAFNIDKSPEVIILKPVTDGFQRVYQGAIDDSPQSAAMAQQNYVQMALNNVLTNKPSPIDYTLPVGCKIK
jgi:thiol-disulfide isomerase/thioredoxin